MKYRTLRSEKLELMGPIFLFCLPYIFLTFCYRPSLAFLQWRVNRLVNTHLQLRLSSEERMSRPPIVQFDPSEFARKDVVIRVNASLIPPMLREETATTRPASYDRLPVLADDPDDLDSARLEESLAKDGGNSDSGWLQRLLKDAYVGSPYDSSNKKQARFVVRSITALSALIGVVFTLVWYAFPGKFISVRSPGGLGEMTVVAPARTTFDTQGDVPDALRGLIAPSLDSARLVEDNDNEPAKGDERGAEAGRGAAPQALSEQGNSSPLSTVQL